MAIKVFCNSCLKYIRDVKRNDLPDLTGAEICTDCYNRTAQYVNDVKKIADSYINKMNGMKDQALAEFDEARRRVLQPGNEEDDLKLGQS